MPSILPRPLRRSLPRTVACALVVGAGGVSLPLAAQAASKVDARERRVIDGLNRVRAQHGLSRLTASRKMSRAADRHSARMLRSRILSHQLPGELALAGRLRAPRTYSVGETVFFGGGRARSSEIVRAWMRSAPHRALLLSGDFTKIGIGVRAGRAGMYATVDLAGR